MPRVRPWLASVVALLVFSGLIYCMVVALSTPGCESVIDQPSPPSPLPNPQPQPTDPLRSAWHSELNADWPIAELLASMSDVAYLAPEAAQEAYTKLGFEKSTPIEIGSMIGYVASSKDVTVIAFRGTNANEIADWFVNLDTLSIATPQGPMHRGFHNAYQLLRPQLLELLEQNNPRHVWVTGHSLGGALALACAYDLAEDMNYPLDGIITFGQPMIGRKQLAGHLDVLLQGRYAHYVNEADIVPRVPPGFTPCGSLVWFKDGQIKRSPPKRRVYGAAPTDTVPVSEEPVIAPMTEAEFQEKKAELQAQKNVPMTTPDGKPIYQGNTPFIRDHSMQFYLEKIREQSKK